MPSEEDADTALARSVHLRLIPFQTSMRLLDTGHRCYWMWFWHPLKLEPGGNNIRTLSSSSGLPNASIRMFLLRFIKSIAKHLPDRADPSGLPLHTYSRLNSIQAAIFNEFIVSATFTECTSFGDSVSKQNISPDCSLKKSLLTISFLPAKVRREGANSCTLWKSKEQNSRFAPIRCAKQAFLY